jgi:hypothetical protein
MAFHDTRRSDPEKKRTIRVGVLNTSVYTSAHLIFSFIFYRGHWEQEVATVAVFTMTNSFQKYFFLKKITKKTAWTASFLLMIMLSLTMYDQ